MLQVLQRSEWFGTPVDLGELFIVRKGGREATCKLFTHQLGWEVRLLVGKQADMVQTQVCRTQEDVFSTGETWKDAMQAKGWK